MLKSREPLFVETRSSFPRMRESTVVPNPSFPRESRVVAKRRWTPAGSGMTTFCARLVCGLLACMALPLAAQGTPTDPTRLPLGDGKVSTSAVRGSVWSCNAQFNGRGGAHVAGPWIKSDGTYDFTAKPTVDGSVRWPHSFAITKRDSLRRIAGNDLPDHPTGLFPVASKDDAFAFDRNPNAILFEEQLIQLWVRVCPTHNDPSFQTAAFHRDRIGTFIKNNFKGF